MTVTIEGFDTDGNVTNVKLDLEVFKGIPELFKLIEKLEERVKVLEGGTIGVALSPLSQAIVDAIKAETDTDVIAKKFFISHYKQLALELGITLQATREKDIIEELRDWYNNNK